MCVLNAEEKLNPFGLLVARNVFPKREARVGFVSKGILCRERVCYQGRLQDTRRSATELWNRGPCWVGASSLFFFD